MQPSLVSRVAEANIALVIFNLIPAFPMDGGRVLRALLAIPLGFTRATQLAARIGQALAVVLGILGLFGSPLLVLIAVFVFLAASAEAGMVQGRDMTRGFLASDAMITDFQTLSPSSTLDDAAQLLLRTTQPAFPVVDGQGVLRGAVTRSDLIEALQEKGGQTPVLDMMRRDVPVVTERAYLESIFQMLQQQPVPMVAVVSPDRRLKGFITRENLADMVMVRASRRPSTVGSRR
jgi:CBS domain-containing protein